MNQRALKMAWQLYADAATRCNLLIDECAHIQNTIHAHLSHLDPEAFGCRADGEPALSEQRAWVPHGEQTRDSTYYTLRPQDRALRNLYASIGALASAIEENAQTLRTSFARVVESSQLKQPTLPDSLFWFVSLRGHLYETVFKFYLKHIEHAQAKLVQLIENMPGTLPGPTLMRRWSSGGYGEFLSSYSRKVNAQVQHLYWDLCKPHKGKSFDTWRQDQILVHSWGHDPTSLTTKTRITSPAADLKATKRQIAITTIWSSYFYLEQPILFPLLFHECAHHFENKTIAGLGDESDPGATWARELWFERAKQAAHLLHRVCPLPDRDLSFWTHFVGELWADLISLSRCGSGFFSALVLQLTGQQGEYLSFSDYDVDEDVRIALNETGLKDRRVLEVQYPTLDMAYFWEARLRFAIKAYRRLSSRLPKHDASWVDDCEALLEAWVESGGAAMSERAASSDHATYWSYRKKLNDWVLDVTWDCLFEFIKLLEDRQKEDAEESEFRLDPDLLKLIHEDVQRYARHVFQDSGIQFTPFDEGVAWRLEDLCPRIRSEFGSLVVERVLTPPTRSAQEGHERWIKTYIDHMACDGSVGFRLAQEWIEVLSDVQSSAAMVLKKADGPGSFKASRMLTQSESDLLQRLHKAGTKDLANIPEGKDAQQTRADRIANLGKIRSFGLLEKNWPSLHGEVQEFKAKLIDAYKRFLESSEDPSELNDGVGTLTLGVLKPYEAVRHVGYGNAFRRLDRYFSELNQRRLRTISAGGLTAKPSKSFLYPLFGEYNFAAYQPGLASINKSFHLACHPACLTKPRAVLRMTSRAIEHADGKFVRVSQIAFRFRWQWVLLAEELKQTSDIFLSSAWEDIILVSHYDSIEEFRADSAALGLKQRQWLDIHSSLGLAQVPTKSAVKVSAPHPQRAKSPRRTARNAPKPAGSRALRRIRERQALRSHRSRERVLRFSFVREYAEHPPIKLLSSVRGSVLERTGRYDVTIDWEARTPRELWEALDALPAKAWADIESIVSALEMDYADDSIELTSQVILRHDTVE